MTTVPVVRNGKIYYSYFSSRGYLLQSDYLHTVSNAYANIYEHFDWL